MTSRFCLQTVLSAEIFLKIKATRPRKPLSDFHDGFPQENSKRLFRMARLARARSFVGRRRGKHLAPQRLPLLHFIHIDACQGFERPSPFRAVLFLACDFLGIRSLRV